MNEKSGRSGRMASIIDFMKGRSPDESLIAAMRACSPAKRRTVLRSIGEANIGML